MGNKKSDTRRFLETMWIMVKYDVLPWMVGAGIAAIVAVGLHDAKIKQTMDADTVSKSTFQKQR